MTALRVTEDFLGWMVEQGLPLADLNSPPLAWGYIALYERAREIDREEAESGVPE